MRERLAELGYAAGWAAARTAPEPVVLGAFRLLADVAWRRRGRSVRQLEGNLARVLGPGAGEAELRALSREGMRSYCRYWAEAFRLPAMGRAGVLARAEVAGWEPMRAAVSAGGAVTALPHMGNWDLAGAWAALHDMPVTAVAEALEPRSLYDRFVAYRRGIGIEVLPLGGAGLLELLERRAREHRLVALVADRAFGSGGVDVELFGEPARMPVGPALVALRARAPLFPTTMWYDGVTRMRVHEPVAVPPTGSEVERAEAMTRALTRVFEDAVRAHPGDWHMLQRLWTADLAAPAAGRARR